MFLYTLHGLKHGLKWGKVLTDFKKKTGLKIVAVSPFFPITAHGIQNVIDAGPLDFLNLIKNAELVFTDSFHGTAFSINMNKPFYSYIGKSSGDNRKMDIMRKFGLEERALESMVESEKRKNWSMSYDLIDINITASRNFSKKWLENALISI